MTSTCAACGAELEPQANNATVSASAFVTQRAYRASALPPVSLGTRPAEQPWTCTDTQPRHDRDDRGGHDVGDQGPGRHYGRELQREFTLMRVFVSPFITIPGVALQSTPPRAGSSTRWRARPSAPRSPTSASNSWPPTRPRQSWRWSATTSSSTAPSWSNAGWPSILGCWCCTGPLQPARQPGRADLGHAQGVAGQRADPDHPGPGAPGTRLLRPAKPGPDADDRCAAELAVAPRGSRPDLREDGRLASQSA
jgi:hypothetical protein